MSRIGKNPVPVPEGTEIKLDGQSLSVKGKKGEQSMEIFSGVSATLETDEDGKQNVVVKPKTKNKNDISMWATTRTLIQNLIQGVSEGYQKNLEIKGVGYRGQMRGSNLVLNLGLSHEVVYEVPQGIAIQMEGQNKVMISGIDKQKVGQVAADIISFRPPEPYKGKGILHEGQRILRKEGKKK